MPGALDWLMQQLGGDDQSTQPPLGGFTKPVSPDPSRVADAFSGARATALDHLQNVLGDMPGRFGGTSYDPNRSLAQNALDPESLQQAVTVGMQVGPAAMIGKGTAAPLFDLSRLPERPDVPQGPIERLPPPAKGVPDWVKAQLTDPAMRDQYKQVLQLGREIGGDQNSLGWWNTFPLRERYVGELGEEAGDRAWRSDMTMLSATSPRHDFPANIRQASYFGNRLAEGRGLPELVRKPQERNPNAYNLVPTESAPKGYANFPLHIQNIGNLLDAEGRVKPTYSLENNYPLDNPKPASMAQNLVGNWYVPTIDVRDLRAMGMKYKSGKPMEAVDPASIYGHVESTFHRPLAEELGLDPAQMQSSTWIGVPSYFGRFDKSGTGSALSTLEDRIRQTAAARGMTPEQVFQRGWLRKEFPLLSAGGGLLEVFGEGVDRDGGAAGK